ncbi:hypothetical protein C8R43DRAFT_1117893 [Mycena crocata]|nr:hypothetical protein C8R43DRAFT_1117893 [Mycena crocata]
MPQPLSQRRGRSAVVFSFVDQAHGTPIQAPRPTEFHKAMLDELHRVVHREDHDLVYRGEQTPAESCAHYAALIAARGMAASLDNLDAGDEQDSTRAATSSPVEDRDGPDRERTPTPELVPTEPASSPAPFSATWDAFAREISPPTESDSDHDLPPTYPSGRARSPTATELNSAPPRKIITCAMRNRKRTLVERAVEGNNAAASNSKNSGTGGKRERRHRPFILGFARRRSQRLRTGVIGDQSATGMTLEQVADMSVLSVAPMPNEVRPIVDLNHVVVGVHSAGPRDDMPWWEHVIHHATAAMRRLHRNGDFSQHEDEAFVRVGMDFGVKGPFPHAVDNLLVNAREAASLVQSDVFKGIAAYQNHLFRRFFVRMEAHQRAQIEGLGQRQKVYPAFAHSPFTTAEFSFGNTPSVMRRNTYDKFGSVRSLTTLGTYGGVHSAWFLYWPEEEGDRVAIHCPPGTTLIIPASIVRYGFTRIQPGETRYVFQQSFNAAVGRWVDHGFMSDVDFAVACTDEERIAHEEWRSQRWQSGMEYFSRLDEVFVQK